MMSHLSTIAPEPLFSTELYQAFEFLYMTDPFNSLLEHKGWGNYPEPARHGEEPAIFEIQNDHLVCGPLVMGRLLFEDRSLMPKRVIWSPIHEMEQVQPIQVQEGEDGRPELKLRDGKLAYMDGRLFSPILDNMQNQKVELRPEFA